MTESALPIPLIDLSGESERHVIVAAGTEETYYCSPTTALMPDGRTLFCVFSYEHGGRCGPVEKEHRRRADLERAAAGARQLGHGPELPDHLPSHRSAGNRPPAGVRRTRRPAASRRAREYDASGALGGRRPHLDADGLQRPGVRDAVLLDPQPIDGGARLLGITNIRRDEDPNNRKPMTPGGHVGNRIAQSISEDGGLTWSRWRITLDCPPRIPGEPELIRSPDGRQLLCLLRDNTGRWEYTSRSLFITSDDEGATWSEPRELPLGLTGDRHKHRHSRDGRLLVTMRNTAPGCPERGDLSLWVGTYDDILAGREGQYRVRLLTSHAGFDGSYSSIELLPDDTFMVATYLKYRPGAERQSIVSVRFKLPELDARL